jgi:RimJ/RimL family protein N-acetyltransferase
MILLNTLTDSVVSLRPFRVDDAVLLHTAVCESLRELKPWMLWAHDGYSEREARDWVTLSRARWNDQSYFGFAITDEGTGEFLGGCSLSHLHPVYHFCNLGYWVRTSRRGQGIAGRAARMAGRFAFERLGLLRAEIVVATDNLASQRVAEKIGAHREGILFNRMVVGPQVHDAIMYSLLPSDFGLPPRL